MSEEQRRGGGRGGARHLRHEDAIVDGDGPHVDEDKHAEVHELVHREEEGEDVVGRALHRV